MNEWSANSQDRAREVAALAMIGRQLQQAGSRLLSHVPESDVGHDLVAEGCSILEFLGGEATPLEEPEPSSDHHQAKVVLALPSPPPGREASLN